MAFSITLAGYTLNSRYRASFYIIFYPGTIVFAAAKRAVLSSLTRCFSRNLATFNLVPDTIGPGY